MKFEKNMNVVYGHSGVCVIEDIITEKISDYTEEKTYYVLRQYAGASTIMVPSDNEKLMSKLKCILSKEQIDELLDDIKNKTIDWIDDRNKRNEYYKRVMAECSHRDMLLLIGCIYLRKKELEESRKKLSMTDCQILQSAVKLVEEEFSISLGIDKPKVEEYIKNRLEIK